MEKIALSLVIVNAPPGDADRIARTLVERRLAACVNLLPGVKSFYVWEGKLTEDQEVTMLIKTRTSLVASLTELVKSLHPYSVPEVLVLPVEPDAGNATYLEWIVRETSPAVESQ
jgi:periplasmic divalent cation tolerance protein